jgi:hypothetical protein
MKRKRRFFGGMAMFYDEQAADMEGVEIRKLTLEDPNYKLQRKLHDKVVQAVPVTIEEERQTTFFTPQNAVNQYEPIVWPEAARDEAMAST